MKICPKCGFPKEEKQFPRRKSGRLYSWCKLCTNAASMEWARNNPKKAAEKQKSYRKRHPERLTASGRKYRYGVTPEEVSTVLAQQDFKCANPFCGNVEQLCVDHDHTPGGFRFRGILCRKCNSAFGLLGDSPDKVEGLLIYAKKTLANKAA